MTTLVPKFKQPSSNALNRAIDLKLAEQVSVKDFGAVGDGITDDTVALNNTIAYIATLGGGVMYLPAGTYLLGTITTGSGNEATYLTPLSGVSIQGCGDASVLKVASGQSAINRWNILLTPNKLTGCVFRDFKIDGNAANNLQTNLMPASSHRFISATLGGKDIVIDNVTFTGNPGNNTVAFSATTDCGNIVVNNCRFTEMGSGIVGNYNLDHTDIYLLGYNNVVSNNYFKSTNFVRGAMFEFHGDLHIASGNYGSDYSTPCGIECADPAVLTNSVIINNTFDNVYSIIRFSSVAGADFGTITISGNKFTAKAGGYAEGFTNFLYGPVANMATAKVLNVYDNTFLGVSAENTKCIKLLAVHNTAIYNNHIENFTGGGIEANATGALLGTYDYDELNITNNTITNCGDTPANIGFTTTKFKRLNYSNNRIIAYTARGTFTGASSFSGVPDSGIITGNYFDPAYTWPFIVSTASYANVLINQVTYPGFIAIRYNALGALKLQSSGVAAATPVSGSYSQGDHITNSVSTVGQPKGWYCTVSGNPGTWVSEGNL